MSLWKQRREREQDLEDEIRFDLEEDIRQRIERGEPPEAARLSALHDFGNVTLTKEDVRHMWRWSVFETVIRDFKFALRIMVKNPGFSTVVVLTLGLGIGANTAIFSVVNRLLVSPLPYNGAERLVVAATIIPRYNSDRINVSYADVLDFKEKSDLFEAVAGWVPRGFDVTGSGDPERVEGIAVDRDYFHVLTDPPVIGRTFVDEEDAPEANRVIVISHGYWLRHFGADEQAAGSSIELDGVPHRIIGVMSDEALFPQADIVKPLGIGSVLNADQLRRDNHAYRAIARLRPGVAVEAAQAELTVMGERIAAAEPNRAETNFKVHTLREFIIGPEIRQMLWTLLGAVLVVLLIACINIANLLLVRGAARRRETAVRNALGAGWRLLAAQSLVESLVLAAAGGVLGLGIGHVGSAALVRLAPEGVPLVDGVTVDTTVLAFTLGLSVVTAVVFGMLPLWSMKRAAIAQHVREGGRAGSDGARAGRLRSILVVSELALAVVLLAGAGLLVRSFSTLQSMDPGLSTGNILTMSITLPGSRYEGVQKTQAFQQIVDSVRALPGVASASTTSALPIGGGGGYLGRVFLTTGQAEPPATADTSGQWSVVLPGYFETIGIPILQGRDISRTDTADSLPVIVISQSMASQMFPGENPIGRRIRSWRDENVYREIVGVVGDVRYFGLTEDIANNVYVPQAQDRWNLQLLVVRATQDPLSLARPVQEAIWAHDPKLAIAAVKPMEQIVAANLARPRFLALLLSAFAFTALLMGAIGVYGLMSYVVTQRTKEIGIRMALGAVRQDISRSIAGRAFWLACAGVAIGIAGALGVTRLLETMLFGVSANDVATLAAASGLLIFTAVLASYVPARRAGRADPLTSLRSE